ncbi:MAG: hypothetical protein Q9P01_19645 [Anaerolineae bacterium]|nr:hypothetical protein [Anaerolineae bacterium]MDQ7036964.1 hypothetical protein [Anaerolineae bacterium]
MVANNNAVFSRPELLCFSLFLIIGVILVLVVRHPKQTIAALITIPIAGLCGGIAYLVARLMYTPQAGTLYGLASFALTGLVVISALRWITSMNSY